MNTPCNTAKMLLALLLSLGFGVGHALEIEVWKMNLLMGNFIIVEGDLVQNTPEKLIKLYGGDEKPHDFIAVKLRIDRIRFATTSAQLDERFASVRDIEKFQPFEVEVMLIGGQKLREAEIKNWLILDYDHILGVLYFSDAHQQPDRELIAEILEKRSDAVRKFENFDNLRD
jgi:hypothetical protein